MYAELAESAAELPESVREDVQRLADAINEKAILPVLGAGASYKLIRLAHELAGDIWSAIDADAFGSLDLPSDEDVLRGNLSEKIYPDLGKAADVVYLHTGSNVHALDAIGFNDPCKWPDGQQAAATAASERHHWAYRILARMTRDRFFAEAITFNYDCHFEGGLISEGFTEKEKPRVLRFSPWPEQFSIIADANSHAQLTTRGDFVLNKVHGCVRNWRRRVGDRTDSAVVDAASEAIILRWSQLLDWRRDDWARDLFRDRARRHVVLLIGFSGTDAVIHSSLRSVMEEVSSADGAAAPPAPRISAIDKWPQALTLQMLLRAGGGGDAVIPVGEPPSGLPEILLLLHAALVEHQLKKYSGPGLPLPADARKRLRRFAVSGPAMVRLSVELLTRAGALRMSQARPRRNEFNETYVPLTWDPYLTVQAFRTREVLARRLDVASEPDGPLGEPLGLRRGVDGRRFIPVGVSEHVLRLALQSSQPLDDLSPFLPIPEGAIPILVCLDERSGDLRYWNAETGNEVEAH